MDPLGEVYTGRDNTGAVAVFGRSPNELGQYYKQQIVQQAAAQKQDKLPEFDPDKDPMLAALGKAHPNDIPALSKDYQDVVKLKVAYMKEKDPMKRGGILQQYLPAKAKLASYVAKSLRTVEEEQKANTLANRDYKHTLPSDFEDRKKQWLSQDIHDRPESFDYGTLNTLSLADNAYKRAIAKMTPSVTDIVTITPEGKKVTSKKTAISEKDAAKSFSDDWDAAMPQNEKNMWTDFVMEAAMPSDGSAPDPVAVEALKEGKEGVKKFAIQAMMVNAHQKLGSGLYKVEPIKPSGSGDGTDKKKADWGVTTMNNPMFPNATVATFSSPEANRNYTWQSQVTVTPDGKRTVDASNTPVTGKFSRVILTPDSDTPVIEITQSTRADGTISDIPVYVNMTEKNRQIIKQLAGSDYYDFMNSYMKKKKSKKSVSSPKTTTNYKTLKF